MSGFSKGAFLAACSVVMLAASATCAADPERLQYALVVHGGAGAWADLSDDDRVAMEADIRRAVVAGRDLLADGGSSLDAVEQVIAALEDSPYFNAGRGATFNAWAGMSWTPRSWTAAICRAARWLGRRSRKTRSKPPDA
jgi:hypothetical protein